MYFAKPRSGQMSWDLTAARESRMLGVLFAAGFGWELRRLSNCPKGFVKFDQWRRETPRLPPEVTHRQNAHRMPRHQCESENKKTTQEHSTRSCPLQVGAAPKSPNPAIKSCRWSAVSIRATVPKHGNAAAVTSKTAMRRGAFAQVPQERSLPLSRTRRYCALNKYLCIFPVEVFGSSFTNLKSCGHLNPGIRVRSHP
jgi:hypothetical protein